MLIFVYEFTCASDNWQSLPQSMRAEGAAMLSAVIEDFTQIDGVTACTLLADDFSCELPTQLTRTNGDEERVFRELAARADLVMVIAPESNNILATRRRWLTESTGNGLNCSSPAIQFTADKWRLSNHLSEHSIPVPKTYVLPDTLDSLTLDTLENQFPGVIKPRWGAGSQDVHVARDWDELAALHVQFTKNGGPSNMVFTRQITGFPASVSFLFAHPRLSLALPPGRQLLTDDGRFRYLGGELPLPEPLYSRAAALAGRAVDCLDGLQGFVGVDVVLGDAADGSGDAVIEINPRLTTSYLGLRQLAEFNLMEALLQLIQESDVMTKWKKGPVTFHC